MSVFRFEDFSIFNFLSRAAEVEKSDDSRANLYYYFVSRLRNSWCRNVVKTFT